MYGRTRVQAIILPSSSPCAFEGCYRPCSILSPGGNRSKRLQNRVLQNKKNFLVVLAIYGL